MSAIYGCTVASRNYLAHARVLAESFLAENRGARFWLLLVDGQEHELSRDEPFEQLLAADVGVDERELNRRRTMYTAQGLSASLKPDLLRELLSRLGSPVVLLDADGCVYASLEPVAELAERHAVVLSPHNPDPYPLHGNDASSPRWRTDSPEQILARAGVMNAGLLAVGAGAEGFLDWWSQRTRRRCVFDEQHGLMLGQTWLTLALGFFEHHVLRDRGCNVAAWNVQSREVLWESKRPTIDGSPLRHFHFAGSFDPERPSQLTPIAKHAEWWASPQGRPGLARLVGDYAERLLAAGYSEARSSASANDHMPDGTPIESWMRECYRQALMQAESDGIAEPPNPFSDGSERFAEWLSGRAAEWLQRSGKAADMTLYELDLEERQLRDALMQTATLHKRIGELERARDEAISWAQRAASDLRKTELELLQARDGLDELERARATMQGVWGSVSWRVTRPLRAGKALLARVRLLRSSV